MDMIFWLFELFFKNEAFNQKSETVHLLGYGWTCFHDSSGPRKLILRMPRPYSEAHEKLGFQAFSSAKRQKVVLELENSIFEKLFKMNVGGSKWVPNHSPSVANCFGTDFRLTEWIWSDFMENENFDFFKNFYLVFKHVLCINPSENGHDFDFLNFFSKMKPLIKNLKR